MQFQTTSSKIGEVKFRQGISKQYLGEKYVFQNELTSAEFKNFAKQKLKTTEKTFKELKKRKTTFSPYLEIGSEYALRPALLETKFGVTGFASDISLYSLSKSRQFAAKFGFTKTAKTICVDANNLPFKSNSFPFVFIYETLHHFPNPKPILEEIKRVLTPGGTLLIGADPISQSLQIKFWLRPTKLRFWERMLKFCLILPFISHIGKTEVEYGIVETAFPLEVWQEALSIFDQVETTIKVFPWGPTEKVKKSDKKNWLFPSLKTRLPLALAGGGLEAICFKADSLAQNLKTDLDKLLICPNCKLNKQIEAAIVKITNSSFVCLKCQKKYKKHQGVLILLENDLEKRVLSVIKK